MSNHIGYNKPLFILPFDHRSSFVKLFGFTALTPQEKDSIKLTKKLIYEAFKKILQSIPKDQAAILVDEEYGDEILKDAVSQRFTTLLTTEKSGQEAFDFEYGKKFAEHIEKYKPTFAKALIRYKPNADWSKLKTLSDYCHNNNYKFLLEVLSGLTIANGESLINIINDLRAKEIEPDVWKLEGMENRNGYESVVAKIREGERQNVGLVILGRGESKEKVEEWIKAGRDLEGVIGFAIGRTIFQEPLLGYINDKISKGDAMKQISDSFCHFYKLFTQN